MEADRTEIERLYEDLSALARRIADALSKEMQSRNTVEAVELTVPLFLAGTLDQRKGRAAEVLADLRQQVEEHLRTADAFWPGRVYCFWCESAGCEHAVPTGRKSVFAGYAPTGRPEWTEFHTACLQAKEPRVDDLFRDPPGVIALVQQGHALVVGSTAHEGAVPRAVHRYDVIGQVAAGYLPSGPSHEPGALTLQVVARYDLSGRTSLLLNALGPFSVLATGVPEDGPEEDLDAILRATRARLGRAEDRARMLESRSGPPPDLWQIVSPVLHRLRTNLERISRRAERRTFHATMRYEEERPVGKALEDARAAAPDRFYSDAEEGTVVVLGTRNRVHVFTPSGRQVTSAVYSSEAVARRLSQNRWKPMNPGEVSAFRRLVEGSLPSARSV